MNVGVCAQDSSGKGLVMSQNVQTATALRARAAVFFVGNQLMADDGIGHAAYEQFIRTFDVSPNVECFDVGCMTMNMISYVRDCDFLLTVDAIKDSGEPAGTVFRYTPNDLARTSSLASLHDLTLAHLFDAAALLGYRAHGMCVGMQVENAQPSEYVMGLSETCVQALPLLVETIAAELTNAGFPVARLNNTAQVNTGSANR